MPVKNPTSFCRRIPRGGTSFVAGFNQFFLDRSDVQKLCLSKCYALFDSSNKKAAIKWNTLLFGAMCVRRYHLRVKVGAGKWFRQRYVATFKGKVGLRWIWASWVETVHCLLPASLLISCLAYFSILKKEAIGSSESRWNVTEIHSVIAQKIILVNSLMI
jgi:hypothetical protein